MGFVKRGRWLALGASVVLAACGAEEVPTGAGSKPMVAGAEASDAVEAASSDEAPVIGRLDVSPREIAPGRELRVVAEARDPEGGPVRFEFVWERNGREVKRTHEPAMTFFDVQKGDTVTLTAVASDGRNASAPVRTRLTVGNRPPVLQGLSLDPAEDVRAGMKVTATPEGQDPDNDELEFVYRWTVNGALRGEERTFDTTGLRRGDRIGLEVQASDGDRQSQPYSIETELGNTPPVIASEGETTAPDGTYQHQFAAEDVDGDRNLRFFLEAGPSGMSMDGITGELRWRPTEGQGGRHDIVVGVKDASGDATTFSFAVDVDMRSEEAAPAAPAP